MPRSRLLMTCLGCALLSPVALAACGSGSSAKRVPVGNDAAATTARPAAVGNPLRVGARLYVNPDSRAARAAAQLGTARRATDAALIRRLAAEPTGIWLTGAVGEVARLRTTMTDAEAAERVPLLVLYHIPDRDCGSYSAGGAVTPRSYRAWVDQISGAIGRRQAAIIVEPDAIPHAVTGCIRAGQAAERYRLLRYAVTVLERNPRAAVYLDAGNAGWIQPTTKLVEPLRAAGVDRADGFALNVGNFYDTSVSVHYGTALSDALGRAHFVIDTGRNGNGAAPTLADGSPKWCNPPGRAVGRRPSTNTGNARVDAYLWVKRPGESDGACRRGEPPAGQWWTPYALGLVRRSSSLR